MSISPGTLLGHYEIVSKIGSGGMGEVYLARDPRLGRQVAIKVLASELHTNRERLARFKQEARATSALNHPNILTIFEIGVADSRYYIVSEFIEGMTLRKRMSRGRIRWHEAVDLAIQIGTALQAAHTQGIVHRDIKPENVMIRTDGYVKVLDFGLAKLLEQSEQPAGSEDSTVANIRTDPAALIGTVAYMSPEQLRLQELDGQTDIWSLGVVLYEMVAACAPFQQPTKSDLIASILDREPPPLTHYVSDIPIELERIVERTLRKDRDERYPTVDALLNDLKSLKQDFISNPNRFTSTETGSSNGGPTDPGRIPLHTDEKSASTRANWPSRASSGVEYLIKEIKSGGMKALMVFAGIVAALVIILIAAPAIIERVKSRPAKQPEFTEIVKTGEMKEAAISPDGNYLAVLITEEGKQGISIRQVANSNMVPIVPVSNDLYRGLVFSRDGTSVYYLKSEGSAWSVFRVATLGGAARKVLANVSSPVALSPDGTHVAFLRSVEGRPTLYVATSTGDDQRELAKTSGSQVFATMRDLNNGPAWSPDGKTIVAPLANEGDPFYMNVVAVNVSDGAVTPVGSGKWYIIGQLSWVSDGSAIVMNAVDTQLPSATFQLWQVTFPQGEVSRITNDFNYFVGVSLTASDRLLSVNRKQQSSIWLMDAKELSKGTPLNNSKDRGAGGVAWTRDGKIIYSVNGPGNHNIWIMDADGGNARQLTFTENADVGPVVPEDGRIIVFTSYRTGEAHIWRMNSDGTGERQLTSGKGEDSPYISRDGSWIVYHKEEAGRDSIWKIDVDGGHPIMLTEHNARQPVISPDGKMIACFFKEKLDESPWQIAIFNVAGGTPLKILKMPPNLSQQWQSLQWTADGRSLTYVATSGNVANLWNLPLNEAPPEQVTNFKENRIVAFGWSMDGSKLLCVRSVALYNLILVSNFRR